MYNAGTTKKLTIKHPGEFSAHADLCRAFGKSAIQRSGGGGAGDGFCLKVGYPKSLA